jgi:hypothetical protein
MFLQRPDNIGHHFGNGKTGTQNAADKHDKQNVFCNAWAMSLSRKLFRHYPKIPGYRRIRPRRCLVFGVGSPKSGTHSLATMFSERFRSLHEAEVKQEIALFSRRQQGLCADGEIGEWFTERSHRLWLDCDVSHLHGHFVAEIAEALPDAKFILTLRHPYSWLDSAFNQTLARPANELWSGIGKQLRGPLPDIYPEQESILQTHGLHPIGAQLKRWTERVERVTRAVSPERLLVIKTDELKQSAERIAGFCRIDAGLLSIDKAHQFPAAKKIGVLDSIDRDYVNALVDKHCGLIVKEYFSF